MRTAAEKRDYEYGRGRDIGGKAQAYWMVNVSGVIIRGTTTLDQMGQYPYQTNYWPTKKRPKNNIRCGIMAVATLS